MYFISEILKNEDIKILKEKTATELYNLSLKNMPVYTQNDLELISKNNIQYFLTKKYELIKQYKSQGMVDFRNPHFIFYHDFILYKMNIHINCILNILDNQYKENLESEEKKVLNEKLYIFYKKIDDMLLEIIFHYSVIDELLKEYPNTDSLINAKEKLINYYYKGKILLMIKDEKKININNIKNIDYIKIIQEYQKKYINRPSLINYINSKHELETSLENLSIYAIGKIEYEIELIYEDYKEMNNYIEFHMKEFIENKNKYNETSNIEEINNIIEEYRYFDNNYELINYEIETLYQKIIYLKYQYLKNNPELINDSLILNDYKAEELYQKLIEEDLIEYQNTNDLIKENIYNFLINYKDDIYKNKNLLSLLLYNPDNLLNWFNQQIYLKEKLRNKYKYFKMICAMNKIIIKEEMTFGTYIYLKSIENTNYTYLINIYKELIKNNKYVTPILTGIKKIDFDTKIGDNLFELLCLREDKAIISSDVELFQTNRNYSGILSSLDFQSGTNIINMKNVAPTNYITITVPSTVNRLNLNFKGKISTIIIDNYRFSPLLCLDGLFINELVEAYYEDISKNNTQFIIGPVNKNSIKLIGIDKEKELSIVLKPEYVDVNSEGIVLLEQKKIISEKKREVQKEFSYENFITYLHILKESPIGVPKVGVSKWIRKK